MIEELNTMLKPIPTPKQGDVLRFLLTFVREETRWPTYQEVMDELGFRSPNSVRQNLMALAKKGYLEKGEEGEYRFLPPAEAFE